MKIHNNLNQIEAIKNPILTIGMFDGVHLGHQHILFLLNKEAEKVNGESVLLTFNPHPRKALSPAVDLSFISTFDEKIELLKNNKLDHLIAQPFNKEFAGLSAEKFVVELLVEKLKIHTLIIGHDHHFGKNREGNFELLTQLAQIHQFNLIQIPAIKNLEVSISSTKIRNALINGDLDFANKSLTQNYSLNAKVVEGDKIGRTIGYPTANLVPLNSDKIILGNAVYAVKVYVNEVVYKGMCNIGIRPTVNGTDKRIEVNIFDFNKDIYNQHIKIEFLNKIRNEQKFNSLEELKAQLAKDKIACS